MLAVKNLTAPGLDDISFEVRAGEILGIGGLPDSGKDGLGEALFGLCERGGRVAIDGKDLRAVRPARLDSRRNVVRAGRSAGRGRPCCR